MITFEACTDIELQEMFAKADLEMRQAGQWGATMAEAEKKYLAILEEMERRKRG
jgi:hypothetical protein